MQVIQEIERSALAVRDVPPVGVFAELDEGDQHIPAEALFDRTYVDKARLAEYIRWELERQDQVSLAELAALYPLRHG